MLGYPSAPPAPPVRASAGHTAFSEKPAQDAGFVCIWSSRKSLQISGFAWRVAAARDSVRAQLALCKPFGARSAPLVATRFNRSETSARNHRG